MCSEKDFMIPEWPEALQHVDVVKAKFILNFTTSCQLQPADFLELGRLLRLAGRPFHLSQDNSAMRQWESLFQPALSDDPIARRRYQKPAPAFVVTMPVVQRTLFAAGAALELEVLFIGSGIPCIHDFLRALISLGQLGLAAGEARFNVTELYSFESDCSYVRAWRENAPLETLTCCVQPLPWLFQDVQPGGSLLVKYLTPVRLLVAGKPLRKPSLVQVFPFMLRRVTSMLFTHSHVEALDDSARLLDKVQGLTVSTSRLHWHDWHPVTSRPGLVIGGFCGEMSLSGEALREAYWVFAVASLLGIGKGATYGAGRIELST